MRQSGMVLVGTGALMMLRGAVYGFLHRERLDANERLRAAQYWFIGVGALALGAAYAAGSLFTHSDLWGLILLGALVAGVALAGHLRVVALERVHVSRPLTDWEQLVIDRCQVLRFGGGAVLAALVAIGTVSRSALG